MGSWLMITGRIEVAWLLCNAADCAQQVKSSVCATTDKLKKKDGDSTAGVGGVKPLLKKASINPTLVVDCMLGSIHFQLDSSENSSFFLFANGCLIEETTDKGAL
jgi:hypothetical protein